MRAKAEQRNTTSGTTSAAHALYTRPAAATAFAHTSQAHALSLSSPRHRHGTPVIECTPSPRTHDPCEACLFGTNKQDTRQASPPCTCPLPNKSTNHATMIGNDEGSSPAHGAGGANLYTFSAREIQAVARAHGNFAWRDASASHTSSVTVSSMSAETTTTITSATATPPLQTTSNMLAGSRARSGSSTFLLAFLHDRPGHAMSTVNSLSNANAARVRDDEEYNNNINNNSSSNSFLLQAPLISREACRRTQASLVELADPMEQQNTHSKECTCGQKAAYSNDKENEATCKPVSCRAINEGHACTMEAVQDAAHASPAAVHPPHTPLPPHLSEVTTQYNAPPALRVPRLPLAQLLQREEEQQQQQQVYTTTAPREEDEDEEEDEYDDDEEGSEDETTTSELSEGAFTQLSFARDSPSPSIPPPVQGTQSNPTTSTSGNATESKSEANGCVRNEVWTKRSSTSEGSKKEGSAVKAHEALYNPPVHHYSHYYHQHTSHVDSAATQAVLRKYAQAAMLVQSVRHEVRTGHTSHNNNNNHNAAQGDAMRLTRAATSSAYLTNYTADSNDNDHSAHEMKPISKYTPRTHTTTPRSATSLNATHAMNGRTAGSDALARWRAKTLAGNKATAAANTNTNTSSNTICQRAAAITPLVRQPTSTNNHTRFTRAATAVASLSTTTDNSNKYYCSSTRTPRPGFAPVTSRRPVRRVEATKCKGSIQSTTTAAAANTKGFNVLQRTNSRREGLGTSNTGTARPVHLFARPVNNNSNNIHTTLTNNNNNAVVSSPRLQAEKHKSTATTPVTCAVKPFARMDSRANKESAMHRSPFTTPRLHTPRSARPFSSGVHATGAAFATTARLRAPLQHEQQYNNTNNVNTSTMNTCYTPVSTPSVYERLSSDYYKQHTSPYTSSLQVHCDMQGKRTGETQGKSALSSIPSYTRSAVASGSAFVPVMSNHKKRLVTSTNNNAAARPALGRKEEEKENVEAEGSTTRATLCTFVSTNNRNERTHEQHKQATAKKANGCNNNKNNNNNRKKEAVCAGRSTSNSQPRLTTQTMTSHTSSRASQGRVSQVTSLTASFVGRSRVKWMDTSHLKGPNTTTDKKSNNFYKAKAHTNESEGKRLSQGEIHAKVMRNAMVWQRLQQSAQHKLPHSCSIYSGEVQSTPRRSRTYEEDGEVEEEYAGDARRTQPHALCNCT